MEPLMTTTWQIASRLSDPQELSGYYSHNRRNWLKQGKAGYLAESPNQFRVPIHLLADVSFGEMFVAMANLNDPLFRIGLSQIALNLSALMNVGSRNGLVYLGNTESFRYLQPQVEVHCVVQTLVQGTALSPRLL